VRNPLFD